MEEVVRAGDEAVLVDDEAEFCWDSRRWPLGFVVAVVMTAHVPVVVAMEFSFFSGVL